MGHTLTTLEGKQINIDEGKLKAIGAALRGKLTTPTDPDYDQVRGIWNSMIDRHPGAIVRCGGAADVILAVKFAADHKLRLAVHGGGHNISGNAVCEGGLMIDLSPMRSVRVDHAARNARVEPGVTLGELDKETQAFGLAVPLGINSTTGVAGLTLGGGYGWLTRKFGLTVDSLISADVVTASGELLHADSKRNADLFWGLRGGGGNFGIVTSFEFNLHPLNKEVLAGLIVYPSSKGPELMRGYRDFASKAADDLTVWVVMRKAPPLPFLPIESHGTDILVFAVCYAGDIREGEKALEPLRALGQPLADVVGPQSYVAWQTAFDPLLTPGARNYWKSHNFLALSDGLIDTLIEHARHVPSPECEIFIAQLGGATSRMPAQSTAFPHRDAKFLMNVHTRWREPSQDKTCIQWARTLFNLAAPDATGGVYVNFMPEDEGDRVTSAFGTSYGKLAKLKAKYDPENLFQMNQNVRPAP
jgi:FAD/FMN-containing dehydrogenase